MDGFGWTSDWIIELHTGDVATSIDCGRRQVVDGASGGARVLRCFIEASYLGALLHRAAHWNSAMISCNLEWERVPDEYDPLLYKALSFLHVGRANGSTQPERGA
jgi:hypothetical protein